ncbi:hypothetical protein [Blastococcus sp. TF02A-35]|uniref:hypothetical protein n=1 Tax=Blastococcus sp. TF02A-35 TaxID=2559612 RepID=UPI001073CFD6|nr:hypothetical protein [Blastococcus sp. TF02A_35]TFV47500.1 hypothetical protein E4P43_14875 [Blastococcus sp. TF02A_35]
MRFDRPEPNKRYPRLDAVHPEDRPVGFPTPLEQVRSSPDRPLAARLSRNRGTRWCLSCDTVLPSNGQSPFCDSCRRRYRALEQRRRRDAARPDVPISKNHLRRVHDYADKVVADLGNLTVAYNTGGDLRREMDATMLDMKMLVKYLRDYFPRV